MMVGGEAFPVTLARDLRSLVGGELINMYGPTETTIWSSTHAITDVGDTVPIGRPIANTDMLVLDARLNLLPPGAPGIDLTANQGFFLAGLTFNRRCYSQENSSPPLIKGTAHG